MISRCFFNCLLTFSLSYFTKQVDLKPGKATNGPGKVEKDGKMDKVKGKAPDRYIF
jgi:hypothetical protein